MFDYLRSSYPLPPEFMGLCQTKNLDPSGDGTMTLYWVDPKGHLWEPDYAGTSILTEIEKDHPDYLESLQWLNFKWVPTGAHGRFRPYPLTGYVTIYPEKKPPESGVWPKCRLHFREGLLMEWQITA